MAHLRNQAVALGGDAIVNFGCYGLDSDQPAVWHAPLAKVRMIPRDSTASPAVAAYSRQVMICNGTVVRYAD